MDLFYFAILCSVLIFVHELGHFVFAKLFGVKVLTFSIGFGPKIIRLRGRETEYCVGLLPLGGFVKMLEVGRQEPVLPEDDKRTFESQALWKRAIIVLAGPAMNLLFPILLYFSVFMTEARSSPPTIGSVLPGHAAEGKLQVGDRVLEVDGERIATFAELRHHVERRPGKEIRFKVFRGNEQVEVTIVPDERVAQRPLDLVERYGEIGVTPNRPSSVIGVPRGDSPAYRAGLRTFDVVTEVRGRPVRTFAELEAELAQNRGETVPVSYVRPVRVPDGLGGLAEFAVYESGVAALTPESTPGDLLTRTGFEHANLYVAEVVQGSSAARAGLRRGDRVVELDGAALPAWSTLVEKTTSAHRQAHKIAWTRGGEPQAGMLEPFATNAQSEAEVAAMVDRGFGALPWAPVVFEAPVQARPSVADALGQAWAETVEVTRFIVVGIVRILEGKLSLSTLGGPITVYDIVGQEGAKGGAYFLFAMAVISINLGLVNLLPIPVLDGGHLVFLFFEALFRRPLPLRVREVASLLGLVSLMALMGVALKNDFERRWDVIGAQVDELLH